MSPEDLDQIRTVVHDEAGALVREVHGELQSLARRVLAVELKQRENEGRVYTVATEGDRKDAEQDGKLAELTKQISGLHEAVSSLQRSFEDHAQDELARTDKIFGDNKKANKIMSWLVPLAILIAEVIRRLA